MAAGPQPDGQGTAPLHPPQRLLNAWGEVPDEAAREWLTALPETARRQSERWELTPQRVVAPGGRGSMVVLVTGSDGGPAALKLPAPGPGSGLERAALERWDGWGAVRLLRADPDTGALLLERLQSTVSLRSLPEPKAVLEAAGTIRRLWVEPGAGHPFRSVAQVTGDAVPILRSPDAGRSAAEARPVLDEALELRAALVADASEEFLLHGDFRQGKVLAGERAPWLAVGPAPLVGERAYDLARLVLDRFEDVAAGSGPAAVLRRRVTRLADSLEVDRERLRGWALYRAAESGMRRLAAGERARGELLLEFAGWL
ncbi:aminoglycoside phosphotransferase family protein [Streptomyces sp. NPDC018031]|uniref:aminoglycoside phosphotransferase family protein n=1 Tax=Streptomyces sp. NPDC018031 TaxID=3365033 RepID=UPI0037B1DFFD